MRAEWLCLAMGLSLTCYAAADEVLPADFLEFLGTASQEDGQWLDPMSLHESPEVFTDLTPARNDNKSRNDSAHPPEVKPSTDTSPPQKDDGGNKDD